MRARRNDTLPITMVEVLFRLDAIIMPSLGGELQTFAVTLIDSETSWARFVQYPGREWTFPARDSLTGMLYCAGTEFRRSKHPRILASGNQETAARLKVAEGNLVGLHRHREKVNSDRNAIRRSPKDGPHLQVVNAHRRAAQRSAKTVRLRIGWIERTLKKRRLRCFPQWHFALPGKRWCVRCFGCYEAGERAYEHRNHDFHSLGSGI